MELIGARISNRQLKQSGKKSKNCKHFFIRWVLFVSHALLASSATTMVNRCCFFVIFFLSQLFLRNVDRYLTYSKSTSKSKREKIFSAYPKCSKYPFLRFFYSVCSTAPHLFPSAIIFYLSLGVCFAHFPHLRDLYIYVESSASYFFFHSAPIATVAISRDKLYSKHFHWTTKCDVLILSRALFCVHARSLCLLAIHSIVGS